MKRATGLILLLVASILALPARAQQGTPYSTQPFTQTGKTVPFVAATTCPTPIQAASQGNPSVQYLITNTGTVPVFLAYATTSATATSNCAIPSGTTGEQVNMVLQGSQVVVTGPPNMYFTGITSSSTADVYVTPGYGQ